MNGIVYKITCLTNLHVGNGESNFDIIDNAVEKDPVTQLPTINSSGVKGALRQYFTQYLSENRDEIKLVLSNNRMFKADKNTVESLITSIFGSDQKTSQKDKKKSIPGKVKFYQADLLARPARASEGNRTHYMVASEETIGIFNLKAGIFGVDRINGVTSSDDNIGVEGVSHSGVKNIALVDNKTIILDDKTLCDLPLPVLARNQLDDGISKNLWYEQVVPHKSIFTFAVSSDDNAVLDAFAQILGEQAYVQFGGNATIGYGLCKVEKIKKTEAANE